jgi:cytochrome c oxidase assembly protein subunit 15
MRLQPSTFRRITIAALVALSIIVVSGGAVRLSGAGLGCDDWPNCNSQRLIDVSTAHAAIEQVNRLFTGVVALAVIAAVLGSLIRAPRRRDLTWWSLGLVAGVIGQVILGGITVLVRLHPIAVQGHFLLSMVLIANATILVRRAGQPDGAARSVGVSTRSLWLIRAMAVTTTAVLVTGTLVTGTGPHAGDPESPRFGFDISHVARIHGLTVMATISLALALAAVIGSSRVDRAALQHPLGQWMFVAVMQAVVGYVQYFTGVPEILVGVHLLGATVLCIVTVQLVLSSARVQPRSMVPTPDVDEIPLAGVSS